MIPFLRFLPVIVLVSFSLAACSSPGRDRKPPSAGLQNGQMIKPGAILLIGFDDDHNYRIDQAEFDSGIKRAFDRADADFSGRMSLSEYQDWSLMALGSSTALPAWIGVDRNGDNVIELAEFRNEFRRLADSYGLKASGAIRIEDLIVDMTENAGGGPGRGPGMGGGRPPGGRPGPRG